MLGTIIITVFHTWWNQSTVTYTKSPSFFITGLGFTFRQSDSRAHNLNGIEFFSFLLCVVILLYSLCLFPVIFLHACQAVLFILCLFTVGDSIGTLFCLGIKWTRSGLSFLLTSDLFWSSFQSLIFRVSFWWGICFHISLAWRDVTSSFGLWS